MKTSRPLTVIEAPSNLGLKPPRSGSEPGVYQFPDALRKTELYSRLSIAEIQRVDALAYDPHIDPETKIRNAWAIRTYSVDLAGVVEQTLHAGHFPLVIGGECSILLGSMLGLRRMGRYGLLFIDGHTDFQTPEMSATGGAAGMDLALVTGYGPALLTDIDGYHPLVDEQDVIVFASRDLGSFNDASKRLLSSTQVTVYDLESVRRIGVSERVRECVKHFEKRKVAGFWVHLDVDALNDSIMPAVDSRQPDGLWFDEVTQVLQLLRNSDLIAGLQITIFDPDLDPDGQILRQFATHLGTALI